MAVLIIIATIAVLSIFPVIKSDPQINLLNRGCSQDNATNVRDFLNNRKAAFDDLRNQLFVQNRKFATSQQTTRSNDPVYAMVQCRNYLSRDDCVSCFDAAVANTKKCRASNGARLVYDGCFLRYESNSFYDQSTLPGNVEMCSNQTGSPATEFGEQAQALLKDLQLATPRITGYFAASKREVSTGGNTVYGVAQCAETISKKGCGDCLTAAFNNLQGCLPNADGRAIDAACFLRYSETSFFLDNQATNIVPFLGEGLSKKKIIIIGAASGGAALLTVIALALILWHRKYRKPKAPQKGNIFHATELQGPVTYDFKVLKTATKDFGKDHKLGGGGFGEVFKGTVNNENIVAIKKLKKTSGRPKEEVESAIRLISNVHHRNLVRLLGCSTKGSDLLLVYEYMANGSLDKFLFGDKRGYLNWRQRMDIVLGTAKCLAYLHEQYHFTVIHRDVKSSNILLDNYFQPKVSDFGLAALMPKDRSHLSSFSGNLGYVAPEYAIHGHLSEKADTYSFGVIVLEIISGKSSNVRTIEPGSGNLLEHALKLHESEMDLELLDETLDPKDCKADDVKKLLEIALLCTQSQPSRRPTMSEVIVMLSSNRSWEQQSPLRSPVI